MSVTIGIRFPWGRYHATPWDRSVNEATVEWPPSTWRLLRALYATWNCRAPELAEDVVVSSLRLLAPPPDIYLPRRAEAHSRHYFPDMGHGTDKVFDPFVAVDRTAEVLFRWEADVTDRESACIGRLCNALPYLGRAESLCVARLVPPSESGSEDGWIRPGAGGSLLEPSSRVLVPLLPLDPGALTATPRTVRRAGRPTPTGSRWVQYAVPAPSVPHRGTLHLRRAWRAPTTVLLALDAPALPSVYDTVWMADVTRQAALARHESSSPTLEGKVRREEAAEPELLRGHAHAHYLPLDRDKDRLLDTIAVWAPRGFSEGELQALGRIRRLFSGQPGFRPVRCRTIAVGSPTRLGWERDGVVWTSETPFIPYRHQKRQTAEAFLSAELTREVEARGLPPVRLEAVLPGSWLNFRRERPGQAGQRRALGLRIRFDERVTGPISLGALSHFGMGQFRCDA